MADCYGKVVRLHHDAGLGGADIHFGHTAQAVDSEKIIISSGFTVCYAHAPS